MLETLDPINWSSLAHAYGPTTDVSDLLRQLAFHLSALALHCCQGTVS